MVKKLKIKRKKASLELISPSSLFDAIEIEDNVVFTDPHSLKKALMKKRGYRIT